MAAVVLAAGESERMGKNKLLLKLGGKRLIDRILDALEASKVDEIVVVLGYKPWEIMEVMGPRLNHIKIVVNEMYEKGMTSSFKIGLKQIKHVDAALLVLGDQIILDPKFIDVIIEHMERNRGEALIISPIYKEKKGHPFLLSKELFNEILSLKENEIIRDVIHRHVGKLLAIEGAKWTTMNINTPRDFEEARQVLEEKTLSSGGKRS